MQSIGIKTTATKNTASSNDRCQFYGSRTRTIHDPNTKFTSVRKSYAPIAYGSKTFTTSQLKAFLAIFFAFKVFGHISWGTPKPITILTDNKLVSRFVQTKIIPPALWNACDYVIQFNFVIAHIPGKNNTAVDYLSRMEMDPKEKLVLTTRADVETRPIEEISRCIRLGRSLFYRGG